MSNDAFLIANCNQNVTNLHEKVDFLIKRMSPPPDNSINMASYIASVNAAERAVLRESLKALRQIAPNNINLDKKTRDLQFVDRYESWYEKLRLDPVVAGHADGLAVIAAIRDVRLSIDAEVVAIDPSNLSITGENIERVWLDTYNAESAKFKWTPPSDINVFDAKRKEITKAVTESKKRGMAGR